MTDIEDALREAFEAGRRCGAYDQWAGSGAYPETGEAPDFEEWALTKRRDTAENGLPLAPITLAEDDVAQVVLLGPTFDWFQRELRARGLYLFPIPVGDEDLPTFGVGVGQRVLTRVTPPGKDRP